MGAPFPTPSLLHDGNGSPVVKGQQVAAESLPVAIAPDGLPLPPGAATETTQVHILDAVKAILAKLNVMVLAETPTGSVNGINKAFTTLYAFRPKTTQLYINGVRMREGVGFDYVEGASHGSITITIAPSPGDVLLLDYIRL